MEPRPSLCTTTTSVKWIQRRSHSDVCPPTEGRVGEADLIIPSSVHIDTLRRSQRAILFSPSSRRGWRNPIPIPSALPPLAEGSGISARACRNVCATAYSRRAGRHSERAPAHGASTSESAPARARAELALHPDTHGHATYLLPLASSLVLPHFPSFLQHFLARSAKHCS